MHKSRFGSPEAAVRRRLLFCLLAGSTALCVLGQSADAPPNDASPGKAIDQCVNCHKDLGDELALPVQQAKGDIHLQNGLGCVGCHGGDSTQVDAERAMDPAKGFTGRPVPSAVPSFCGKCHSDAAFMRRYNPAQRVDQEAEYATSVHGTKLRSGNNRVATCVNCHGSHGIRPINHPESHVYAPNVAKTCGKCHADPKHMQSSLPTRQVDDYGKSVHAEALLKKNDLSAPTCNDCHGNHGASPPGVTSVANVCGACHTRQAEMFRKSVHNGAFREMGQAECVVCHDNHRVLRPDDTLLAGREKSVCATCHGAKDAGFDTAQNMSLAIGGLQRDWNGQND